MTEINTETHIINNNEDTESDLEQVAQRLYDEKKYDQALKIYSDMLLYSSNSDIYVKMGNCFENQGKIETAIEYWQKAADIDPLNFNAYINLGNYYFQKNKIEKAITYWIASLLSMPEEPTSNLNLAIAYTMKEMPIEANIYFEKYLKYAQDKTCTKYKEVSTVIEKNKKLANDYLKLGVQYQSNGDNLSALKCYKRAMQYFPIFSKIHLNLGSLYFQDKKYDEAVTHWTHAEYIDPNYPKTLCNMAISYDMLKKYDYAYCYYTKYANLIIKEILEYEKVASRCYRLKPIIASNPYWITNHLEIAQKAMNNCEFRKAINEFKNYLILNPDDQEIYADLVKKLENYINPEKNVIKMCQEQGKLCIGKNDYKGAKAYYARILVLSEHGTIEYNEAKRRLEICLQHS